MTGAGRNIGEAIAHLFAAEGARVAVVDIDRARANRTAEAIRAGRPDAALPLCCDVADGASVRGMLAEVLGRWGGVDILVNNVAVTDHRTVLDLDEAEWDRVLRVTLSSVFVCCKYVGRAMVERGRGGRIVNITSTSGYRGRSEATAYTAAKGGVVNLTRSLAIQLAPYGIRVNSVAPNRIGSPVGVDEVPERRVVTNLVGRPGVPMDIAQAVTFLVSDEAAFITATDLLVDGGALAVAGP